MFDNWKPTASRLGDLMTKPRGKTTKTIYQEIKAKRDYFVNQSQKLRDGLKSKIKYQEKIEALNTQLEELEKVKDEIKLSDTAKAYLREEFIRIKYGRKKEVTTKQMEKGTRQEEVSLSIVTEVTRKLLTKNKERLSNEWIEGTPDTILNDMVIDIKTKWNIWNFMEEKGDNPLYDWQMTAYMWLTQTEKASIYYTLVDTPEELIYSEWNKELYRLGILDKDSEEAQEVLNLVEKNNTYEDIPKEERIKRFDYVLDIRRIEEIKKYVQEARKYLNSLKLNSWID